MVHDNFSVDYMRFPVPEHKNLSNVYAYRQSQVAVQN